jgi:hypothetical protein
MRRALYIQKIASLLVIFLVAQNASGQALEWRLANPVYNNADPDGAGPAIGSVSFVLQIHTVSGSIPNITGISTGWSWQSSKAMLPTTGAVPPTCGTNSISPPSNVVMSATFAGLGFTYNNVDQCSGTVNFSTGGQTFDRRSSGTIDGGTITLTTTWTDIFTVTLWTRDDINPKGGYVVINSGAGGSPGAFSTYAVTDAVPTEFVVNSLTFTTPLLFTSPALPTLFTRFDVQCQPNKSTSINWSTSKEINNNYFEVEKSANGITWGSLSKVSGSGNSAVQKSYQVNDAQGGAAFYRLKQVDLDGKVTYSNTVKASCEGRNLFVTLYPVPAKDVVTLVVGSDKSIKTALQVFDNKGRMVINMPVSITTGTNNFNIPVLKLAAGEYIIRSFDAGIEINKRFTVIR